MHRFLAIGCNRLQPIFHRGHTTPENAQTDTPPRSATPNAMHPGIANLDLSRVTSSLDDKMASAADASTGNGETKKQINVNWTNDEAAAIIDIWANVEIQGQFRWNAA